MMTCQVREIWRWLHAAARFFAGCAIAIHCGLHDVMALLKDCCVLAGPGRSGNAFDDEPDISSDDDRGNNASDVELSD